MMLEIVTSSIGSASFERILALLLDASIKGTMLLSLATVVSFTLRKSSAATRHRMWALTMLSLLALPLLPPVTLSVWSVTVPTPIAMFVPTRAVSTVPTPAPTISSVAAMNELRDSSLNDSPLRLSQDTRDHSNAAEITLAASSVDGSAEIPQPSTLNTLVPLAFLCGAILCLLHLAIGTWRVMQFRSAANRVVDGSLKLMLNDLRQRLRLNQSVELRLQPDPVVPMTLGVFRPVIVLPRQSSERSEQLKRIVLLHELAHVKRRDIAFQWLGRLACSLYWFHPLAWWGLKQLRKERELACDDLVVHCGERATDYAEVLVSSVAKNYQTQRGLACAVAMAQQGNLEGRMRSLFDKDIVRSHKPLGRLVAIAMLVASALAVSAVSAMQLAAEPPDDDEARVAIMPEEKPRFQKPEPAEPSEQSVLGEFAEVERPARVAGPLERTVKVIDESGNPVAGATIVPMGFGTTNGTGWSWIEAWPKEYVTNSKGIATVHVPEELTATISAESGEFTYISFRVEHPDFAPEVQNSFRGDDRQPVTLSKGVAVAVKAIDSETNQQITSDLYAVSSGNPNSKWKLEAGILQSEPFNPKTADTGRYFRIVYASNEDPDTRIMFSDVIDASSLKAEDHRANPDVELHPGVELSGSLSPNVERPVKDGGSVTATILSGSDHQSCAWHDVAPIAEDGTFKFAGLPRDSHVELIAVCDGWVSKCPEATLIDYDLQYGTEFAQLNNRPMVASTPFRLESDAANVIVNMVETGICEFTVVDEHDDPVDLVAVMLSPSGTTRWGTIGLGPIRRSIDTLRNADSMPTGFKFAYAKLYTRVTNAQGITTLSNLPPGRNMITVDFPGYAVVSNPQHPTRGSSDWTTVDIGAVGLEKKVLHIRKGSDLFGGWHWNVLTADGISRILLRIVDADGVSLPNAKINLVGQTITHPGEKQPWPVDWPAEFSLHTNGLAIIRIPRPANVPVEDLEKASIWIDIEADGCVPLKNHEVSLSQRLPIRLQAARD